MTSIRPESQAEAAARSLPDLFATVEAGLDHAERAIKDGKTIDLSPMQGLIAALCAQLATADKTVSRAYIDGAGRLLDSLNRLEGVLSVSGPSANEDSAVAPCAEADTSLLNSANTARFHQVYATAATTPAVKKGH